MSRKFAIFSGGYEVSWAGRFDSRAEAEAFASEVGEGGGWDEWVEVCLVEGEEWAGVCDGCGNWAYLTAYTGPKGFCEECDKLA